MIEDKDDKSNPQSASRNIERSPAKPPSEKLTKAPEEDDVLELASPGDFCATDDAFLPPAAQQAQQQTSQSKFFEQKQTTAPVPPPVMQPSTKTKTTVSEAPVNPAQGTAKTSQSGEHLPKLTSEQAKDISERLNSAKGGLSQKASRQLIQDLESRKTKPREASRDEITSAPQGSISPKSIRPAPPAPPVDTTVRGPARGVAFYNNNTITLTTSESLKPGDEITINGNRYKLRYKKAASEFSKYLLVAGVVAVTMLGGQHFLEGGLGNNSVIVGVALDKKGNPYKDGAIVRLPELGQTAYTNENGLFSFGELSPGDHTIEYTFSGSLGGTQTVSVTNGQATLVSLRYSEQKALKARNKDVKSRAPTRSSRSSTSKSSTTSSTTANTETSQKRGALAVTSSTSSAIVYIDNQRLGTVNQTFRRMRPGSHQLRIEKAGYETFSASIDIASGKIARVNVDLSPTGKAPSANPNPPAVEQQTANDLYKSGREAFQSGRYDMALASLNKALSKKASLADAHFLRAEILSKQGQDSDAFDAYVRAGEIWSMQKRYGNAISALDNALELDPEQPVGFKVRGDIYRARGHTEIAIDDYKQALDIDKKYYEARLALGKAYLSKGASKKAQKEFRRAQDINDQDPVLYQYLMITSLARNDHGKVNAYFNEFIKIASESDMNRFRANPELADVREIVED